MSSPGSSPTPCWEARKTNSHTARSLRSATFNVVGGVTRSSAGTGVAGGDTNRQNQARWESVDALTWPPHVGAFSVKLLNQNSMTYQKRTIADFEIKLWLRNYNQVLA
jgi:hypothetical protein